jgi:hypothetical protein
MVLTELKASGANEASMGEMAVMAQTELMANRVLRASKGSRVIEVQRAKTAETDEMVKEARLVTKVFMASWGYGARKVFLVKLVLRAVMAQRALEEYKAVKVYEALQDCRVHAAYKEKKGQMD